jgi:hypothetical protein
MLRVKERVTIKSRTRDYWEEILAALLKFWPELSDKKTKGFDARGRATGRGHERAQLALFL